LLGLVVNTINTPLETSASILSPSDIDRHLAYSTQQQLDGYSEAVHHAIRRKATFDKKVLKSKAGVVVFEKGQLVQVYRNDLMNTLSTDKKLQPTWSGPYRIHERLLNSYKLEDLDGTLKTGEYSARRLRLFTPRDGTELARDQKELEDRLTAREEDGDEEARDAEEGLPESGIEEIHMQDILVTSKGDVLYDSDEEEGESHDGEGSNIASRVAGRRGRRQMEGGRWNRLIGPTRHMQYHPCKKQNT